MAEMTIRLRTDPTTGKKDIVIDLRSDEDALPHEHEEQHRALVRKLIEGGLLSAEEVGQVIVERDRPQGQPGAPIAETGAEGRRSEAEGQG